MKKFKILLCFIFFVSLMVSTTDDAKASCIACTTSDDGKCAPWGWYPNPRTICFLGLDNWSYPACKHGITSTDECPGIADPG